MITQANKVTKAIKSLTIPQMSRFLEYIYEEGAEGVEFNSDEGYSSVQFATWANSERILKRIRGLKRK